MSLATVTQLYSDLQRLADKNPVHQCDYSTVEAFNSNLLIAKEEYPESAELKAMSSANRGATLRELFVMAGQLKAILDSNEPILFDSV